MKKIVLSTLILCSNLVFADDAAALDAKLKAMQSMSASFSQQVKAEKRQVSRSEGTMALQRPGRFRWDTKSPMKQLLVADGKKLWIYDVELEQVTVKKQEKSLGGTAALFLSGYDNQASKDFNVSYKREALQDVFDLHAKSAKSNFQRVKLVFLGNALDALVLYDQLGQRTDVHFTNIKINPQLSSKLFSFKPPKGVDLVEQ